MTNNFPEPERVLVIVAHPDDPEFGAAGTCAVWAALGAEVTYVIVTDGSKGSAEEEMTREKLIEVREAEQRQAAEAVGVSNLVFLRRVSSRILSDSPNKSPMRKQPTRLTVKVPQGKRVPHIFTARRLMP